MPLSPDYLQTHPFPVNQATPSRGFDDKVGYISHRIGFFIGFGLLCYFIFLLARLLLSKLKNINGQGSGFNKIDSIINNLFKNMNNTQKTVLKVMVPVIIIIAAVGLASADNYGRPFELGSTGGIWVGAGILITGFIYKMSKDK